MPADPDDKRSPDQIPEAERDYFLERKYPSFGNLVPRDVASRNAKTAVDQGKGVGPLKNGVYLDFGAAIARVGEDTIRERYGNLFDMYERITDENPYKVPMRIYPAVHYTMGGLWVDYNLMSNVPGLFVLGEANFSDHGANRLGASALMQGLADGYFVHQLHAGQLPGRPAGHGARCPPTTPPSPRPRSRSATRVARLLSINGTSSVDHFHRELGKIMWEHCGMARNQAGLEKALAEIPALREEFWKDVRVLGGAVAQPVAREGHPRGRLLRARRADGPRRPAPRGVVRRPLPRGEPDRGGRGAARRRALRLRGRVGVDRQGLRPRAAQASPSSSTTSS